jgi:CheY-like chemotaxis protein
VDLEEAVAAALPMVRRILGHGFEVAVHRGPPAGRVFADPGGVLQALAAAASRARAAMREGGAVTVETARVILDEEFARRTPGVLPGTYAMLAVRDGGPPLGEEECRRVLEPSAEGSETSLAPVAEFARRSGGHVLVRPDRARGNTVRVYLPRYEGAAGLATAAAAAGEAPAAPSGGRTVLLAEDEEAVRTLIAETLRMEGHEVVEARDGAEALRVAAGVAGPIHLLLTDLQMPGMTGPDLAGRLLAERPGMRVLFVTGYFERPEGGSMDLPAGAPVLLKPFTPAALAEKVRETLGTASPGAAT